MDYYIYIWLQHMNIMLDLSQDHSQSLLWSPVILLLLNNFDSF
jgi:hypothetical protein